MEYSVDHLMFKMTDKMFVPMKSYIDKPIDHLYIPKSVCIRNIQYYIQSILPHAFYQMTINTIDLRDATCLKYIQEQAFDECVIHKIYLPPSVSKIGHTAFYSSITKEVFIEPYSIHFCNCESKFFKDTIHHYTCFRFFISFFYQENNTCFVGQVIPAFSFFFFYLFMQAHRRIRFRRNTDFYLLLPVVSTKNIWMHILQLLTRKSEIPKVQSLHFYIRKNIYFHKNQRIDHYLICRTHMFQRICKLNDWKAKY